VTTLIDFLDQLPIFANLTEDQLDELADICQEYEFDEGAVIAYQRDVADSLYIVQNGRLYAQTLDKQGVVRSSKQYFPGDHFKEQWLFASDTHPATVTAASDGQMVIINGQDFLKFLIANPDVLPNLEPEDEDDSGNGLSHAGWEEAQKVKGRSDRKSSAVNLLPDELVEYQARRSRWYLLIQLFWPTLGLILLPSILYILLNNWGVSNTITLIIIGFFAFVFFVMFLFRLIDWANDYFVITNKHLIHHEFDLRGFRITINKIPVKQVQSVSMEKPTLLANLFKIGTAKVTTSAQKGVITFDNIDDPSLVQEALNRLTSRVRALNEGEAQAVMRQSLENHFEIPPPLRESEEEDEEIAAATAPRLTAWQRFRNRFAWRVVEGNTITYRKHFFTLIAGVWLPTLIAFGIVGLGSLLIRYSDISAPLIAAIFSFANLFILGWFIWNLENWRNDTFQVSDRFVVDIDRQPFGFSESRKQAPIANIQNVNAARPGLLPTIFNYGFVYIETAGVDTDITFEYVPRPSQIQADIFQKLEMYEQTQRKQLGADRREEYTVLLDVWRQALEQDRIPRRTPSPGEFVENPDPGD
jgi:uncharacterized membrane protein YdbT with pleckstrin-like domain